MVLGEISEGLTQPLPEPTATAVEQPTATVIATVAPPRPRIDVSLRIDQGQVELTAELSGFSALVSPGSSLEQTYHVYVVRDDGTEWDAGPAVNPVVWTGTREAGGYRVEVRNTHAPDEPPIISGRIMIFAEVAAPEKVVAAIAIGVAAAGAVSVIATTGFNFIAFVANLFFGMAADKSRDRTKSIFTIRMPSWLALAAAVLLMTALLTAGRSGALAEIGLVQALAVTGVATLIFKIETVGGALLLASINRQANRYFIWTAGVLSLAFTSIVLHSPFGYTGYLEPAPTEAATDRARDARIIAAGLGLIAMLVGVFLLLGRISDFAFAEAGISLALGSLGAASLPFPLLGGHAIWKWSQPVGIAAGLGGFVPYFLFQRGALPHGALWAICGVGAAVFTAVCVDEVMLSRRMAAASMAKTLGMPAAPTPTPAP